MKQIKIGNGELVASQLIMGCMRIVKVPKSDADALVHTALDNGINFFDHADVYGAGKSEEVFGEILDLRSSIRDKIIIQDKCTLIRDTQQTLYNDTTKEHIIASVDGSLKRLKTDYLDTYLLHRPDTLMEADRCCRGV